MNERNESTKLILRQIDQRILLLQSEIRYWQEERQRLCNPEDPLDLPAPRRRPAAVGA